MKLTFSMISAGAAALLAMVPTPAMADSFAAWQKWTTVQGCIAMIHTESIGEENTDTSTAFNWVGDCTPGQMITGTGTLEQHGLEYGSVDTKTGKMVNGYWEGVVQSYYYEISPDGTWNPKSPEGGGPENYIRGCMLEMYDGHCDEMLAENVIVRPKVNGPLFKVAGAPARAAKSAPAGAATGVNGDVYDKCVQIDKYPADGGIQTVWAMHNVCTQPIIVSYCFKATVQAAGDPNLCSRREKRTSEIRGNGTINFPFTLVEPGQAMSDGTIAGANSLFVRGFACTGGSFPNVYFDEGQFLSRGC